MSLKGSAEANIPFPEIIDKEFHSFIFVIKRVGDATDFNGKKRGQYSVKTYIDGAERQNIEVTAFTPQESPKYIEIGKGEYTTYRLNGKLDQLRILSRPLYDKEISKLYIEKIPFKSLEIKYSVDNFKIKTFKIKHSIERSKQYIFEFSYENMLYSKIKNFRFVHATPTEQSTVFIKRETV